MRTITGLPAGTAAYASFFCLELERPIEGSPSVYYRYTNASKSITLSGNVFSANVIEFDPSAVVWDLDGGHSLEILFQDQNDTIKALAFLYDFRDWTVRFWEVYVDSSFAVYASVLRIQGTSDGVEGDANGMKDVCKLGITADSGAGSVQGPREGYEVGCRFRYGSARCGVSGGSCNRTYTNCVSNANAARFGGFPDCPTPGATKLFFGTTSQVIR